MIKDEYENVKKFYQTLKLKNLGEVNKIYNFQDTIILCKIFEQRSNHLQKLFKFNQRKCNSASSFSGCVHRDKSKCLIALPTDAEHVRVFQKTFICGFSCVNTRLAFETQILLLDKENEKAIFDSEITGEKQAKRISTKILKIDENNQYGQAMTKPLPYGCIKKQRHVLGLVVFNILLDKISHKHTIGHLFIVDIKFHNINENTLLFNGIYRPIFEKNKKMEPFERSTVQLINILVRNEEKDFVVMNQKTRQKATSSVEHDFYKLLNNSNFGIDCRNNIGNCVLEPL